MRVGVTVTAAASTSYAVVPAGLGRRRAFRPACRAIGSSPGADAGFNAPNESGRASAGVPEPEAATGATPRRGPGRPPGIPAWNKGLPHSETHRKRISMKLKQKWKDAEFKRSVTESMMGKKAWNAGQPHDPVTIRKMSEAKLGRRQPLATRKLMSQAALGHKLSEEAKAKVGDRFRGQPKSEEHRSKLAAMARRRHAATRVLRAVEAVYSAASSGTTGSAAAATSASAPSGPRAPGSSGGAVAAGRGSPAGSNVGMSGGSGGSGSEAPNMGAVRAAAYSMGLTGLSDGSGRRLSRTQILNSFKAELREYRALQEELSTWTAAFREKNHRKPNLVDVQRTGIPWLIEKFKQYVVLRDRLFSDTSVLRGKLQEAIPDPESLRSINAASGTSSGLSPPSAVGSLGPTNANGPNATARTAVASRFAAVMDYKMQRQARPTAVTPGAPSAGISIQEATARPRVEQEQQEVASPATSAEHPLAARMVGSQAPPRVRMAMQAAMEYRQKQAQATKAAADAAAAAARAVSGTRSSSARAPGGGVEPVAEVKPGAECIGQEAQKNLVEPSFVPSMPAASAQMQPEQCPSVPALPAEEVEEPAAAIAAAAPCLPLQAA